MSKSENELDLAGTLEYFLIFKIRSNFIGTEFILYSNGLSYKNSNDSMTLRQELALIHYEYQLLKTRSKINISMFIGNTFKAFIPALIEGQPRKIIPRDENTGLKIKRKF